VFVGCDGATETHDVTVMDNSRTPVNRWEPALTGQGIAATLAGPGRYGDPAGLLVAVEATRGLVVDRLLAAGRPGVPVHPNAFHAMHPRWGASKAKTGAEDSDKLADNSRHGSDGAANIYTDAQARKKRHPRAVRILARAWLRVIWARCRDGACHASAIHQANNEVKPGTETPLAA
jgi:hypothetical protein